MHTPAEIDIAARSFIDQQAELTSPSRYAFFITKIGSARYLSVESWRCDERGNLEVASYDLHRPTEWLMSLAQHCEVETDFAEAKLVTVAIWEQLKVRHQEGELLPVT